MAKSADYFVTGVWFKTSNNSKSVSHVLLHTVNENNSFNIGYKVSESAAIELLKRRYTMKTLTWNYNTSNWQLGTDVLVEKLFEIEFLRTHQDSSITDNLDHLINMSHLPA